MSKTHAEILADIAKQVVDQHRQGRDAPVVCAWCKTLGHTVKQGTKGTCPPVDPSWDYMLPEVYRD